MSIYRNFVQDLEKSVTRKLVGKAAGFNYHFGFYSKKLVSKIKFNLRI